MTKGLRILVTGAHGFIGSYVLRLLQKLEGLELLYPSRLELNLVSSTQVQDLISSYCPHIIIHLASVGIKKDELICDKKNLLNDCFLENILQSIQPSTRLVVAGSMSEYGQSGLLAETVECKPETAYAQSKLRISQKCRKWSNKYGYDIRVGRIFGAYGFGENADRLFPTLLTNLKLHQSCSLSDGQQKRDFIHVFDIAISLLRLCFIRSPKSHCLVNIGTGRAVRVKDIAIQLANEFKASHSCLRFSSINRLPGEHSLIQADTTLMLSLLKWVPPQRLTSREAIASLLDYTYSPPEIDWQLKCIQDLLYEYSNDVNL